MKFIGRTLILLAGIIVGVFLSSIIWGEVKPEKSTDESTQEYKDILSSYEDKLTEATSKLLEELEQEREDYKDNHEELAVLTHEKITELAKINNEGTLEMADVMREQGDNEANYTKYALELTEIYMKESSKLADANGIGYKR